MEAKDTVMDKSEINSDQWDEIEKLSIMCLVEKQAEISFKAGQQNGLSLEMQGEAYCQGVLVGIREVVKLLMTTVDYECEDENGSPTISFWFAPEDWQAKLKEWEIKEIKDG